LISTSLIFAQKEHKVPSKIDGITVYLKGAQINRKANVDVVAGKSEIAFTELSPYLNANSLQVSGKGNFTILSVSNQRNFLEEVRTQKQSEADKIIEIIEKIQRDIRIKQAAASVLAKEEEMLLANSHVIAPHRPGSMTELNQVADNLKTRLNAIYADEIDIEMQVADLQKEVNKYQEQVDQIYNTKLDSYAEVVVKIEADRNVNASFELSYLVDGASWYPNYDLRVKDIENPVALMAKANINQNTGIDWKDVALTISTGDPSESGVKPELLPYYLKIQDNGYKRGRIIGSSPTSSSGSFKGQVSGSVYDENGESLPFATVRIVGTTIGTTTDLDGRYRIQVPNKGSVLEISFIGFETQNVRVHNSVIDVQLTESSGLLEEIVVTSSKYKNSSSRKKTSKDKSAYKTISKSTKKEAGYAEVSKSENTTVFEYTLKSPFSLVSDNKVETVDYQQIELPANYQYYAVPRLDKDAFLTAQILDWEQYNLLEGEVSLYFEGTFIGQSILNTMNAEDTLTVSLGRDKGVVVKREIQKDFSKKKFLAKNKVLSQAWKIDVKNNKNQAINIIVEDRIPISGDSQIEVEVQELSKGKKAEETNIVQWDLNIKPKETQSVDLKYSVKYPKRYLLQLD